MHKVGRCAWYFVPIKRNNHPANWDITDAEVQKAQGHFYYMERDLSMRRSPQRLLQSCTISPIRVCENSRIGQASPNSQFLFETRKKLITSRSAARQQISKSRILAELPRVRDRRGIGFRSPTIKTKLQLLQSVSQLKSHIGPPTIELVSSITHILETIANEEGAYEEEMHLITKELVNVIYCPRTEVPEWLFTQQTEFLLERYGVPYFAMVERLLEEVSIAKGNWEEERIKRMQISDLFEKEIRNKEGKIEAQSREIDSLKRHIDALQKSIKDLKVSVRSK